MNSTKTLLPLAALFLFTALLPAPSLAEKVATVDMAKVLRSYDEVKRAVGYIKEKKDEYQKVIDSLQDQIRKINTDIQNSKEKGGDTKGQETEKRKMIFELQKRYQSLRGKLDRIEAEEFDQIKDRIKMEIGKLVKKKDIDLVIEKQWIYHGASLDLTDELLKILGSSAK